MGSIVDGDDCRAVADYDLISVIQQSGDPGEVDRALAELQRRYQRLIKSVMHRFGVPYWARASAVEAANVAIWEAARRFDTARGLRFATYATHRIRKRIWDQVQMERPAAQLDAPLNSDESLLPGQCWCDLDRQRSLRTVTNDGEQHVTLRHAPQSGRDHDRCAGCDPVAESVIAADEYRRLRKAVEHLPERAAALIKEIYWEDTAQASIADRLGVSRPRISQLHARARRDLGTRLELDTGVA